MKTENRIQLAHVSTTCLLRMLLRHVWMIVAAALICAMCASLYLTWAFVPKYTSTMTYAVTARRTSYSGSANTTATKEVAAVLTQMLEADIVREGITAYDPVLADFSGTVGATQVGESNMIIVTTTAPSPEQAFLAMCAVRDQFPTIVGYLSNNCIVQVIRNPGVSGSPVNQINSSALSKRAAIFGALAMTALLAWFSVSRETIQTRTGATHLLDANIIATVGRVRTKRTLRSYLSTAHTPVQVFSPAIGFGYTEQINTICAQLEHENAANGRKSFLITGVGENEGKSTISGNVAAALAMMGKKVAIVDCDLRNPSLNRFFDGKYAGTLPLNRMLAQPYSKEALLQCMVRHDQLGLFMLFPVQPDRRCAELLTGETMKALLHQLSIFDYVILDTPPMGYFADTETLMDMVDATILVVRQDCTPACDINDAADLLRRAKSEFLGVVLNDMTTSLTEGHHYGHNAYGYGRYGYGYGHYGYKNEKSSKKS